MDDVQQVREEWRKKEALKRTAEKRPDLLRKNKKTIEPEVVS
jgi:tRNA G37 N-methylase TrmD